MIAGRGPQNVLVVDRTCVPVWEVCDQAIEHSDIEQLLTRFNITEKEVFECLDAFSDLNGPTGDDFIEFSELDDEEPDTDHLSVITSAVSDWVFITVIGYGRTIRTDITDLTSLFSVGLSEIFRDCLLDISQGHFNSGDVSEVHELVFMSYQSQIKMINADDANRFLANWEY